MYQTGPVSQQLSVFRGIGNYATPLDSSKTAQAGPQLIWPSPGDALAQTSFSYALAFLEPITPQAMCNRVESPCRDGHLSRLQIRDRVGEVRSVGYRDCRHGMLASQRRDSCGQSSTGPLGKGIRLGPAPPVVPGRILGQTPDAGLPHRPDRDGYRCHRAVPFQARAFELIGVASAGV